jgi:alkylation response protein AidB-like acyl-CoA dehydrogenase
MMKARSAHTQAQRFVLDEEERIVRDSAHAFATARMPIRQIRAIRDSATAAGFDLGVWAELAALGWAGMAVSEEFGGAGLGIRALAAVIEKMGETLGAAPLASTALVAATVIARFAPAEVAARWLPKIARGQVVAALAVDEADHAWDERLSTTLDSEVIDGAKRYVADGVAANLLLVSAMKGEAPVLALVHADAPGVAVRRLDTIDGRGLADIEFQRVHVDAVLTPTAGRSPLEHALDCARIGLAAEMLGASSRAFEVTLDYMRTRRQFGQPIGSFQALQHRAAKLYIEIELTRSCVLAAVDALHHDGDELASLVSLAKAASADLMHLTCHEMIQFHGGIGMTDAHDAGFYLKRGRVATLLHGDAAYHRDRYAKLKGY